MGRSSHCLPVTLRVDLEFATLLGVLLTLSLPSLLFANSPQGWYYHPHFTDMKVKAQSQVTELVSGGLRAKFVFAYF